MADFVTLTCPSCGGKLEITNDVERFACAHCGQEHIVKRSGGAVLLSPVVDALKKVGVGVDKTAAELAIVRLQKELFVLQSARVNLSQSSPRPTGSGYFVVVFIVGCIFFAGFLYYLLSGNIAASIVFLILALILLALGGLPLFVFPHNTKHWDETTGAQLKSLDEQISHKTAELQRNKDLVSN